jgi:hypothetical protein
VVRVFNSVLLIPDTVRLSPSCGGDEIKARDDTEEPAVHKGSPYIGEWIAGEPS